MALIEGFRIENYRVLRDVSLGRTEQNTSGEPLPSMLTVIGPNGSGKSTLMDALGFLGDCLAVGVEEACEVSHRGGFERLRTRGVAEPIRFEIAYRQEMGARLVRYKLSINMGKDHRPYVENEELQQARAESKRGRLFPFLKLEGGRGFAWAGTSSKGQHEGTLKVEVVLDDPRRLGITSLGNLAEHPRIVAFRKFLQGWYLSYFVPDMARALPMAGAQKHLDRTGQNLANYVEYMERTHKTRFKDVLERIKNKIPGISTISTKRSDDGRLLIQFNEKGYKDVFFAQDMSDGTLKMFAYLLLLEDPEPPPLIGIEEPENGLHHQLLEPLAVQMKNYAEQPDGPQILVTTHSTYFVDALTPADVWILGKSEDGFSTITRSADIEGIRELAAQGIPLGSLWYSNHFGRGNP